MEIVIGTHFGHAAGGESLGGGEGVPDGEVPGLHLEIGVHVLPADVGQQQAASSSRQPGPAPHHFVPFRGDEVQGDTGQDVSCGQAADGPQGLGSLELQGEDPAAQHHQKPGHQQQVFGLESTVQAVTQSQHQKSRGDEIQHRPAGQVVAAVGVTAIVEHQEMLLGALLHHFDGFSARPILEYRGDARTIGEGLGVLPGKLSHRSEDQQGRQAEDEDAQVMTPHKAPLDNGLVYQE